MTTTTLSSREFSRRASEARKAADNGPVFITDGGRPTHVLLNTEDYRKLAGGRITLAEALAQPAAPEADFDCPRVTGLHRLPDLS